MSTGTDEPDPTEAADSARLSENAEDAPARRRGLRDPLWHVLALGAAAYGLWALLSPGAPERSSSEDGSGLLGPHPIDRRVVVGPEVEATLREQYEQATGRPWSDEVRAAALERWVDEEILYRVGLSHGLDRDDPVAERRLIKHMRFVQESSKPIPAPSDAQLQAWIDGHPDRYRTEATVDYDELFIPAATDTSDTPTDAPRDPQLLAASLVARLEAGEAPAALKDELPVQYGQGKGVTLEQAVKARDATYARHLAAAPLDTWTTLERGGSYHIIRIDRRTTAGNVAPLGDVRDRATEDWTEHQRAKLREAAMAELREGVTIEHED